jgi:peptidyl-prolyl cis-trans isomerase A (cyclophilin A)
MSKTFATLKTNLGDIKIELFPNHAPKTVKNFIGLSDGTGEWTDLKTGKKADTALYNGTIFHRVIPGFMIQGGDPLGSGRGGPGYQFEDEFHPELVFDKPYLLAMANAGPGTNGSQLNTQSLVKLLIKKAATLLIRSQLLQLGQWISQQKMLL